MSEHGKPRLARLTSILTHLQSKSLLTARELAKRYDVSVRTIYRDIRTLEQSGIPIITEEGRGYSLLEGYHLPPVMFTEHEANALITVENLVQKDRDDSLVEYYLSATSKIKSVLKNTQRKKIELLSERIQVRNNTKGEKTSNFLIRIQSAISNFKLLEIRYNTVSNKESKRKVEPFALYTTKGNWIMVAYCRLRKDFRAFRLDRIKQLIELDLSFEPHKITLQDYFDQCRERLLNTPDILLSQSNDTFASNQINDTMQKVKLDAFQIIGIAVRTINDGDQGAQAIGQLWNKFLSEGIADKIPNKVDNTVYSLYTDYEGDHTQPYTAILGCKVSSLASIPEGMIGKSFDGSTYEKIPVKGDLTKNVIFEAWLKIWQMNLDRKYSVDFEVFGEKAQNPQNAEVDIFIAVQA